VAALAILLQDRQDIFVKSWHCGGARLRGKRQKKSETHVDRVASRFKQAGRGIAHSLLIFHRLLNAVSEQVHKPVGVEAVHTTRYFAALIHDDGGGD
jgi:predicted GNAT family N-acyltransferase